MSSFLEAVAYYLDQSGVALLFGSVAGAAAVIISMANHFPGW